MTETKDERHAFIAAFVQMQAVLPNPGKTKTAQVRSEKGSYSYSYADLAEVVEVVRPVMAAHGLAFTQPFVIADGMIHLETRVMHTGGHVESFGDITVPVAGTEQQNGSRLTYLRRYALLSALGLAPGDDDDGKAATDAVTDARGAVEPQGEGYGGTPEEPPAKTTKAPKDCLHTDGTRTHRKGNGETVDVCKACGTVLVVAQ